MNVWWTYDIKDIKQKKREAKFSTPELCTVLCNALIQPCFDYACPVCYPDLNEKIKNKIKIMQNKCIWFFLRLDKMYHKCLTEFRSINSLPTKKRVHQCINAITFKFANNNFYLNEIFELAPHCRIATRNSFAKLKHPFRKANTGQKTLSSIGPSLWKILLKSVKDE